MKTEVEVWYDFETTGLNIEEGAAAVQFSCQIVVNGEVVDTINENINPYSYPRPVTISEYALRVNGYKEEDFASYPSLASCVNIIKTKVYTWGSKYKTKAVLIGFNNSTFDKYFIEEAFELCQVKFDSFFKWKQIDVFELVKALQFMGIMGETYNQKLRTIAEYFKIDTTGLLHNALQDVIITRTIFNKIKEKLNG